MENEIFDYRNQLICPIEPACHPLAADVQATTEQWVLDFELIKPAGLARYSSYKLHKCAAYAHPNADFGVLRLIADTIAWLILSDDHYDEMALGRDPTQMNSVVQRFVSIADKLELPPKHSNLEKALLDICQRIARYSRQVHKQFVHSMKQYWHGCSKEASFRKSGRIPSRTQFVEVRSASVGMKSLFDLIVLDRALAPGILNSPYARRLRAMASWLIALVNDLDSFDKEMSHNDCNNLVVVLATHATSTLDAARAKIVAEHNQLMSELLRAFEEPQSDALTSYAYGIRSWVRAVYDWEAESARYAHLDNASVVLIEESGLSPASQAPSTPSLPALSRTDRSTLGKARGGWAD